MLYHLHLKTFLKCFFLQYIKLEIMNLATLFQYKHNYNIRCSTCMFLMKSRCLQLGYLDVTVQEKLRSFGQIHS
jgi:hypothetical protein